MICILFIYICKQNCLSDILSGVKYSHSVGVLHRDLKPQNLLISPSNKFTVKIADFGLARTSMIPKLKLTTEVVTLWYRPIEIFLGAKKYGFAVDLWGIGTVFYEMLTDNPLFKESSQIGVIMKIFQFRFLIILYLLQISHKYVHV